jgi:hypothetical protein
VCIWSLVSHSVTYIRCLKEAANPSLSFSSDGNWLAVVGEQQNLDCISIFSTTWKLRKVNVMLMEAVHFYSGSKS